MPCSRHDGHPEGEWVWTTLPGGTTRMDWVPTEQPPSPDGTSGRWHVVSLPGQESRWEWYPGPVAARPAPTGVRALRMALAVGAATVLVAGFFVVKRTGSDSPATAVVADSRRENREDTLRRTLQGFYDALMAGNGVGIAAYTHPKQCTDEDRSEIVESGGVTKQLAGGEIKVTVEKVRIEGNRGDSDRPSMRAQLPDHMRRVFAFGDTAGDTTSPTDDDWDWLWENGQWYWVPSECSGTEAGAARRAVEDLESCRLERSTVRTAIEAYIADRGTSPQSVGDLTAGEFLTGDPVYVTYTGGGSDTVVGTVPGC